MHRRTLLKAGAATLATTRIRSAAAAAAVVTADRFSVAVRGTGPDVILVPGVAGSRDAWGPEVTGLADRYRLHLVQVAGFAGEPARADAHGPICTGIADSLAAYIDRHALRQPAYVGHSMGGTVGLMLAERHPAALGRLLAVDELPVSDAILAHPDATPAAIAAIADGVANGIGRVPDATFRRNLREHVGGMILTADARDGVTRQAMLSDQAVVAQALHDLEVADLRSGLSEIRIPTTIVYAWNRRKPETAAQVDAQFRTAYAGLRGVRLVRIDETGHFIFVDQPAKFGAALREFLSEQA